MIKTSQVKEAFKKVEHENYIETCKPQSCIDYPFTDQPERLFSLISIIESASVCPVVFEMIERLKIEYGFKRNVDRL